MDGRGRWLDNVSIERLWRSMKYACVVFHAFETASELRAGLTAWVGLCTIPGARARPRRGTLDECYRWVCLLVLGAGTRRRALTPRTSRQTEWRHDQDVSLANQTARLSEQVGPPHSSPRQAPPIQWVTVG